MGDVIDFFSRKIIRENANKNLAKKEKEPVAKADFAKTSAQNKANQERLRKEREQANKNVMKSYRIK
ncbi:hypothetical protein [Fluviispira sanaruensis]|uniref:Uncharacterized protein n=1 Tax=Fluviispira sanaruensis TaxID=2493639 RepID=A0A4P2VJ49_FLUSA|nr:hypothetical protein [Fluviispira sanaruensis]BBH52498.1 hypothetical protein JCM31447_09390 [Fluviispira sanaruensis]